jgi:hypothetical protein
MKNIKKAIFNTIDTIRDLDPVITIGASIIIIATILATIGIVYALTHDTKTTTSTAISTITTAKNCITIVRGH